MKRQVFVLCVLWTAVATPVIAGTLRIAHFRTEISPEIGAKICGYSPNQISCAKLDPLYACGLAMDDGKRKALMISFDLLGLDGTLIRSLRAKCATELGTEPAFVFMACTHTHEGPESVRRLNLPNSIDADYVARFEAQVLQAVRGLGSAKWKDCDVFYHSAHVDENYNRRFVTPDNHGTFVPHRPTLAPICDGPADKELGVLFFMDASRTAQTPGGDGPEYLVGNYAAHALSAHAPGLGGIRISADFPGCFRDYLKRESGVESMFVAGAAGDLVPKNDELGSAAARRTGENLAMAALRCVIAASRGEKRFIVAEPRLGACIRTFRAPMRSRYRGKIQPEYGTGDTITLEVQCLAIGDLAFVGMPGEAASEIGSEIKWHSPFRRTWVANLSTGFAGYISPANAFVQGGYEPKKQPFSCRAGLTLVNTVVDALFALRQVQFPEDGTTADPYPDNLDLPLVSIPGGVKETNFRLNEDAQKRK